MPDDFYSTNEALPWMIEWVMYSGTTLTSLPRRLIGPPAAKKSFCRHLVPVGAKSWRYPGEKEERSLETLPPAFLAMVNAPVPVTEPPAGFKVSGWAKRLAQKAASEPSFGMYAAP